jgi:hypothetical protein
VDKRLFEERQIQNDLNEAVIRIQCYFNFPRSLRKRERECQGNEEKQRKDKRKHEIKREAQK